MILHWSWKPDEQDTGSLHSAETPYRREQKENKNILEKIGGKIVSITYDIVRIPWKVRWERVGDIIR
jgi:hypothetical protein